LRAGHGRKEKIDFEPVRASVPTLFRLIVILAILAGLGYGSMWALATFVEPEPREMTSTIPPTRLMPR